MEDGDPGNARPISLADRRSYFRLGKRLGEQLLDDLRTPAKRVDSRVSVTEPGRPGLSEELHESVQPNREIVRSIGLGYFEPKLACLVDRHVTSAELRGSQWTDVGKLETMRSTKDRLGWKRLALVCDLKPSRSLEPVFLEKCVLAELSKLGDCLDNRRAFAEITESH